MSVVVRLLAGCALTAAVGLAGAPVALAQAAPCDDYSQGCQPTAPPLTPTPTPTSDGDGGGGEIDEEPTAPPAAPLPVEPTPTTGTGGGGGGADGELRGSSGSDGSAAGRSGSVSAQAESLPLTGGDVVLLSTLALAAIGGGTALVLAGRRRPAADA